MIPVGVAEKKRGWLVAAHGSVSDPSALDKMHDYEKIRRLFFFGVSAMVYYKYILPDLVQLHKRTLDMDIIATSMVSARGDLFPPKPLPKQRRCNYGTQQVLDHNSNCI